MPLVEQETSNKPRAFVPTAEPSTESTTIKIELTLDFVSGMIKNVNITKDANFDCSLLELIGLVSTLKQYLVSSTVSQISIKTEE